MNRDNIKIVAPTDFLSQDSVDTKREQQNVTAKFLNLKDFLDKRINTAILHQQQHQLRVDVCSVHPNKSTGKCD